MTDPADDVAALAACHLYNMLPALMQREPCDVYAALQRHFRAAIAAARVPRPLPKPSDN